MTKKSIKEECSNCDSYFTITYQTEMVTSERPEHCPFCGELIEDYDEEFVEEELDPQEDWD
jgi:predicted  nucleic acid-binding Zn-ribbon protein